MIWNVFYRKTTALLIVEVSRSQDRQLKTNDVPKMKEHVMDTNSKGRNCQTNADAFPEADRASSKSSYTEWQPDMSCIPRLSDTQRFLGPDEYDHVTMTSDSSEHVYEELNVACLRSRTFSGSMTSLDEGDSISSTSNVCDTWTTYSNFAFEDQPSTLHATLDRSSFMLCPPNTEYGYLDANPDGSSLEESTNYPNSRQEAVHQLLTCEQDFCRLMKRGIQRFSRPLRHHVMSPAQHQKLFQNVEKVNTWTLTIDKKLYILVYRCNTLAKPVRVL